MSRNKPTGSVRRFVDEEVVPVVGPYWERAEICWPLVKRLPELGIVGEDIKGYGCAGMSPMACGLVTMELHRGDGSLGVFLGVHAGLAMLSIAMCGSEEQKARWLPDMAQMTKLGAFALTEPEHGSDSVALETSARRDGEDWVLNGRKRWIGLGSVADLVVVWARNTEDGQVNGFVVEKGTPGYQARVIEGKVSLRSVWQAPAGSWPPPGAPAPGRRLATPPPPTTPPCATRRNGASSASRWPASRSSSSGWCRCWRT
jgi:glutaryl-CoA dehydrogenase